MFPTKEKRSSGAVSTILLILGVVLIVLIIIVFVVIRIGASKSAAIAKKTTTTQGPPPVPLPVYDSSLGDVRFVFEKAEDLGNVMETGAGSYYHQVLNTTEKFIK